MRRAGAPESMPKRAEKKPPPSRAAALAELALLAAVVALGIWLRLPGLTRAGLWRDDAWVALASRVDLGTALRMGSTTLGFTLLERAWILLDSDSSLWAQLLPLAIGVAGIVAVFVLTRNLGLPRPLALFAALVIALAPVPVTYSTRVKQYGADLLLSCAVLGLAETARRRPEKRALIRLGWASFVAMVVSAAIVPVLAGAWSALLVAVRRDRASRRRVALAGASAALACGAVAAALVATLPPPMHRFWKLMGGFVDVSSPAAFLDTSAASLRALFTGLAYAPPEAANAGAVALGLLLVAGAAAGGPTLSGALPLAAAYAASVAQRIPLGTGRTDEVLYPAVVLLAAAGLHRLGSLAAALVKRPAGMRWAGYAALALLALADLRYGIRQPVAYPVTDMRSAARELEKFRGIQDFVLVDPFSRYPWALYEESTVRVVFGPTWGARFSVESTRPGVYIAPSEPYEDAFDPAAWARRAAGAPRAWYVLTHFYPSRDEDPVYRALVAEGWRAEHELGATGVSVLLLVRR